MAEVLALHDLLQHVAGVQAKHSDQVLQEQLGIGLSQFRVLQVTSNQSRPLQQDIAARLGQTEASISRQIRRMVAEGLVQIVRGTADKRERHVVITRKGERLMLAASAALEKYHRPGQLSFTGKQQEQFHDLLHVLHTQLCPAHDDGNVV